MYDDNQTELPPSFIELFMLPGAVKPREAEQARRAQGGY